MFKQGDVAPEVWSFLREVLDEHRVQPDRACRCQGLEGGRSSIICSAHRRTSDLEWSFGKNDWTSQITLHYQSEHWSIVVSYLSDQGWMVRSVRVGSPKGDIRKMNQAEGRHAFRLLIGLFIS